ncbi:hypothetical protein [Streptomyces sp. cg35]|uniref:hypothetical protein n=1 Tax=Streptomyces sp. cg35 TaxID=3421650 RepID=UPI003D168310
MTAARIEPTDTEKNFSASVDLALRVSGLTRAELGFALQPAKPVDAASVSRRISMKTNWLMREMHAAADLFGVNPLDMCEPGNAWVAKIDPSAVRNRLESLHTRP